MLFVDRRRRSIHCRSWRSVDHSSHWEAVLDARRRRGMHCRSWRSVELTAVAHLHGQREWDLRAARNRQHQYAVAASRLECRLDSFHTSHSHRGSLWYAIQLCSILFRRSELHIIPVCTGAPIPICGCCKTYGMPSLFKLQTAHSLRVWSTTESETATYSEPGEYNNYSDRNRSKIPPELLRFKASVPFGEKTFQTRTKLLRSWVQHRARRCKNFLESSKMC